MLMYHLYLYREKMAFFTRTKATVPMLPDEDDVLSEDDWEEELEERRTPDGRSSKTSYELKREAMTQNQDKGENQVIECKNPCLNHQKDEMYQQKPANDVTVTEEAKTEDVRYDFVVDRVLGVQV